MISFEQYPRAFFIYFNYKYYLRAKKIVHTLIILVLKTVRVHILHYCQSTSITDIQWMGEI